MDELNILLQAMIDTSQKSIANINKQILELQAKLKPMNISLNIDGVDTAFKNLTKEMESQAKKASKTKMYDSTTTSNEISKTIKDFKSMQEEINKLQSQGFTNSKNTTSLIDYGEGNKLKKMVSEYNDELSHSVKFIQLINTGTGKLVSIEKILTNNIKARSGEIDKLANKMGEMNEKSQLNANKNANKAIEAQNKAINAELDKQYNNLVKQEKLFDEIIISLKKIDDIESSYSGFTDVVQIENLKTTLNSLDLNNLEEIETQLKSINTQVNNLETNAKKMQNTIQTAQIAHTLKEEENAIKQIEAEIKLQEQLAIQVREVNLAKTQTEASLKNITKSYDNYDVVELERLEKALNDIDNEAKDAKLQVRELQSQVKLFGAQAKQSSTTTNSFADSLKRFTVFYGLYDMLQLGKRAIQEMTEAVLELDAAILEVQKVAEIPNMEAFIEQSYEAADALKILGTEFITGVADASRMGYSLDEAFDMSEIANKMVIVGDGIESVEQAMGVLQSTLALFSKKGYEAEDVLNLINETANNTGVSFGELSDMLSRSASVGLSGSSLESIIALNSTLFEVTRNAESSATAINMINQRLMGLDVETGEQSMELVSVLGEELKLLSGVDVFGEDGGLKDTATILEEVAQKWSSLNKETQLATATLIGNNRHAKSVTALMSNWDTYYKSLDSSMNSANSAQIELQAYLDSTTGKVEAMKGAMQELWITTLSSDFVGDIAESATAIIKFTTEIGGLTRVLNGLLGVIVLLKSQKIGTWIVDMGKHLATTATTMGTFAKGMLGVKVATEGSMVAMKGFQAATGWIGLATIAITGIASAISYMSKETERAREEMSVLNDEIQESTINHGNAQELAQRYEELSKLTKEQELTNEQAQEYTNIQNELHKLMPEISGYIDEHGNFIATEAEMLEEVNKHYREYIALKREEKAEKATDILDNSITQYQDDMRELEKLQSNLGVYEKHEAGFELTVDEQKFINATKQMGDFGETVEWTKDKINELQTDSNKSLSELRQDLIDATGGTETWTGATEQQQEALQKMLSSIDSSYIENYSEHLKSLEAQGMTTQDALDELAKVLFGDSVFLGYLATEVDTATDSLSEYDQAIETTTDSMEEYLELVSEFASGLSDIDSAIQTLAEGGELTAEQIVNLRNQHEALNPILDETTGRYTLELEELLKLRDGYIDVSEDGIKAEIELTKQSLQSVLDRIGMYELEIEAIQSRQDAINAVNKMISNSHADAYEDTGLYDDYFYMTGDEIEVTEHIDKLGELQEKLKDFDIYARNNMPSVSLATDESNDSSSVADTIEDEFAKAIEAIQKNRDALDREIAEVDAQINVATVTGDMDYLDKLSDKMNLLLKQRMEETVLQNEKYEGLKKLYTAEEQLLEIETLLSDNNISSNTDTVSKIESEIDALERKYAIQTTVYDDEIKRLEYDQMLYAEESNEYIALEEQKLLVIYEKRKAAEEMYQRLREQGLSNEHEMVQEYKDAWYDYDVEIRQIQLDLREIEVAMHEKQIEELEEIQEAKQAVYDMAVEMVKQEAELKKESLQDELDGYEAIIDAKKEMLRDEQEAEETDNDIAEKEQSIVDLQNELLMLEGVDGEDAKAKRLELEEEINSEKEALADLTNEKLISAQEDALDEELERFTEIQQAKIDEVDDFLSKEGEIREEALKLVDSQNQDLYENLKAYHTEYCDTTSQEFEKMWTAANGAIGEYELSNLTLLETMQLVTSELEKQKEILSTLQTSSVQYTPTVPIPTYHSGGIVGGTTNLKSSEEFSKLLKGEVVASIPQINTFMNKTLPNLVNGGNSQTTNVTLHIDKLMDFDKLDNNVDIESVSAKILSAISKKMGAKNIGFSF